MGRDRFRTAHRQLPAALRAAGRPARPPPYLPDRSGALHRRFGAGGTRARRTAVPGGPRAAGARRRRAGPHRDGPDHHLVRRGAQAHQGAEHQRLADGAGFHRRHGRRRCADRHARLALHHGPARCWRPPGAAGGAPAADREPRGAHPAGRARCAHGDRRAVRRRLRALHRRRGGLRPPGRAGCDRRRTAAARAVRPGGGAQRRTAAAAVAAAASHCRLRQPGRARHRLHDDRRGLPDDALPAGAAGRLPAGLRARLRRAGPRLRRRRRPRTPAGPQARCAAHPRARAARPGRADGRAAGAGHRGRAVAGGDRHLTGQRTASGGRRHLRRHRHLGPRRRGPGPGHLPRHQRHAARAGARHPAAERALSVGRAATLRDAGTPAAEAALGGIRLGLAADAAVLLAVGALVALVLGRARASRARREPV